MPNIKRDRFFYEEVLKLYIDGFSKWLDAGCGFRILPWESKPLEKELFFKAGEVVGVDIDFNAIRKHGTIKKLVLADLEKIPFKNGYFNIITLNTVVEHFKNPLIVINGLSNVLKKGGKIVIHTPNRYGYVTLFCQLIPVKWVKIIKEKFLGSSESEWYDRYYRANTRRRLDYIMRENSMNNIYFEYKNTELIFPKPLLFLEILYIFITERIFPSLRSVIYAVYEKR